MAFDISLTIWISVRPILKLFLNILLGVLAAKFNMISPDTARELSGIIVWILVPSLFFQSIVTGISNASQLGVTVATLIISSCLYTAIAYGLGHLTRIITKPPRNFRNGVIFATCMANSGDICIAVVGSIVSHSSYGAAGVPTAIAYIAIFNLPIVFFYFLVAYKSVADDFKDIGVEDEQIVVDTSQSITEHEILPSSTSLLHIDVSSESKDSNLPPNVTSKPPRPRMITSAKKIFSAASKSESAKLWLRVTIYNANNWAVILGIVFANVSVLRNLLIPAKDSKSDPPLGFVFETMQFVGNSAVPLGLINVGYTLGRLNLKTIRPFLKTAFVVTVFRLIAFPAILFPIVYYVVKVWNIVGLKDDNILMLVLLYEACVPTAVSLIYFTLMLSKGNGMDAIGSVFAIQYPISIITMTLCLILSLFILQF
ncbi:Protein M3 [Nowakowskiella sp. JEL0407]|nr:Protein M3 [Nowakowskiella sp. JEL0407]